MMLEDMQGMHKVGSPWQCPAYLDRRALEAPELPRLLHDILRIANRPTNCKERWLTAHRAPATAVPSRDSNKSHPQL